MPSRSITPNEGRDGAAAAGAINSRFLLIFSSEASHRARPVIANQYANESISCRNGDKIRVPREWAVKPSAYGQGRDEEGEEGRREGRHDR